MKFREVERLIKEAGWFYIESKGSHCQYGHPDKKGKVTIPYHAGEIPHGTLNSILRQAGIKENKK